MIRRLFETCAGIALLCTVPASAQKLVLPGDHPDPSVTKIGNTYWATATTSNWMPAYPLLKSTDLVHWQRSGSVFPKLPDWADYYFWAPEISYENGKVYVYYAAHKKGGNLCLGIASADKPEGPYKDHGPLLCQEVGSIDAFPMRDENGKLHLIWKEDANSVGKPTPIWIQEMNEERTALIGEKKELFRNDIGWEANLVEGVSMIRQGDYFYAFFAGAGCCGRGCTYATGVARAKNLLGPWEKYRGNPIDADKGRWKCPGHGTPVKHNGRFYFLYHAYDTTGTVYTGRQGLLKEFRFTKDNWIEFIDTKEPVNTKPTVFRDEFNDTKLHSRWQWSVFQPVKPSVINGHLHLPPLPDNRWTFLGIPTLSTQYAASVQITRSGNSADAGVALIGDDDNLVAAVVRRNEVAIIQVKQGKDSVLATYPFSSGRLVELTMHVRNGYKVLFSWRNAGSKVLRRHTRELDASYLPPWDRALRAGIVTRGQGNTQFERFETRFSGKP